MNAKKKTRPNVSLGDRREASHTKKGPGRRAHRSANRYAPRTTSGRPYGSRLPVHIVKPVRAARLAAERAAAEAS